EKASNDVAGGVLVRKLQGGVGEHRGVGRGHEVRGVVQRTNVCQEGRPRSALPRSSPVPARPGVPLFAPAPRQRRSAGRRQIAFDEQVNAACRTRLADLREGTRGAGARFSDTGRTARARAEIEALTEQLAAGASLVSRRAPGPAGAPGTPASRHT